MADASVRPATPGAAEELARIQGAVWARVHGDALPDDLLEAVSSAEAASRHHGIVVLATNSRTPIIDPSWLAPGTHVTTLGPKQSGASEFGLDLVEAASVTVTDSLAQLHAYRPPNLVASSRHAEHVLSLGAVVSDPSLGRPDVSQITLYLSVGLAGTDVYFLSRAVN